MNDRIYVKETSELITTLITLIHNNRKIGDYLLGEACASATFYLENNSQIEIGFTDEDVADTPHMYWIIYKDSKVENPEYRGNSL